MFKCGDNIKNKLKGVSTSQSKHIKFEENKNSLDREEYQREYYKYILCSIKHEINNPQKIKKINFIYIRYLYLFNEIKKITIKTYSNQSNMNIHYCLKPQIPIMHRQFFKKCSQNREFVNTFSADLNNPFLFGIRKWMINQ